MKAIVIACAALAVASCNQRRQTQDQTSGASPSSDSTTAQPGATGGYTGGEPGAPSGAESAPASPPPTGEAPSGTAVTPPAGQAQPETAQPGMQAPAQGQPQMQPAQPQPQGQPAQPETQMQPGTQQPMQPPAQPQPGVPSGETGGYGAGEAQPGQGQPEQLGEAQGACARLASCYGQLSQQLCVGNEACSSTFSMSKVPATEGDCASQLGRVAEDVQPYAQPSFMLPRDCQTTPSR